MLANSENYFRIKNQTDVIYLSKKRDIFDRAEEIRKKYESQEGGRDRDEERSAGRDRDGERRNKRSKRDRKRDSSLPFVGEEAKPAEWNFKDRVDLIETNLSDPRMTHPRYRVKAYDTKFSSIPLEKNGLEVEFRFDTHPNLNIWRCL